MESKISVMKRGYKRSLKAAQRQGWSTLKTKMEFFMLFTSDSRHSGGFPIVPELSCVKIPPNWKKYMYHRGLSWNFQCVLGKGLVPGGNEKDKAHQAVFLTPINPFGNDPEEDGPHDDFTVP